MKTTVTLEQKVVNDVLGLTAAKNKTRAVTVALEEFVRRKKIDQLRSLLGRIEVDENAVRRRKKLEVREEEQRHG